MEFEVVPQDSSSNTKYKDGVNQNARLIVRNISYKATEQSLRQHFSQFGTVEEVKLLKKPDGKLVGCGFVHYTHVPMANAALAATNKKDYLGRQLSVSWAVPKHKYDNGLRDNAFNKETSNPASEDFSQNDAVSQDIKPPKNTDKNRINRKARLIIRNVSFKATDESLKEHFAKHGDVLEVNLLKKPDGKLVGCAFVHFKNVPMAKKALLNTNMKPFLGRPISVDWAVAKNKYMQHTVNQQLEIEEKVKKEDSDSDNDNDTPMNISNEDLKREIKSESEDDVKSENDVESENESNDSDSNSDSSDASGEDEEEDETEEEADDDIDNESQISTQDEKKRIKLNDAEDGCTVFVTNIPFSIDNDQLRMFAENFGTVKYALVCVDKMTEHSKGSGFVKFLNKEDAEGFLSLPMDQLKLEGQVLQVKPALKRENLQKGNKKDPKDNRNLYLVKEGVIVAGTKAAVGVSASDMTKRLTLERSKTQMLKNLNRFVSRYRLVVSNLPAHYDDVKLRRLCMSTVGRNAVITEARVMRDLRGGAIGKDGKYESKGYGFVMFTKHEDALTCIRKLNNNPDVFDKNNRPIISFSIEDRTALNARKKRLEKSKANNPLANVANENQTNNKKNRKRKSERESAPDESYVKKGRFGKEKATENSNSGERYALKRRFERSNKIENEIGKFVRRPKEEDVDEYIGLTAKQGSQHKMRNSHKLKTQADIHRQNLKLEKKNSKRTLRFKMAAKERVKQPKQKINKNKGPGKRRRFKRDKSVL